MMNLKGLVRSLRQAQDCLADADERDLEVDSEFTYDISCIQNGIHDDLGLERGDERRNRVDRVFTDWTYQPDKEPVTEKSPIVKKLWGLLS